jgi:Primase C terminal 2 (PriCT-2)/Family of unknown function (DUF5906)/Bifunctional DNA primase/polymerase, N-terminal
MTQVCEFAKKNSVPLTAIKCHPHFDDTKSRVAKGNAIPHPEWKKKGRYEPSKVNKTITGDFPTMWMMDLKKAGFFVLDVDVRNGKTAKEVVRPDAWDKLMETCAYIVQTGSGGVHFYFKVGEVPEGHKIQQSIKDKTAGDLLDDQVNADVDVITEQIIVEGSSFEYEGKIYKYTALKGSVDAVVFDETLWSCLKSSIVIAPRKKGEVKTTTSSALLERLVMNISNDETTDWDKWYKVAQAIYNENGDEDLFLRWSALSPKHDEKTACQLWKGLKKGDGLTAGSLYYWSSKNIETHEQIVLDCLPPEDYQHQKVLFERTHFKLMNPAGYVCVTPEGSVQMINEGALATRYGNLWFNRKTNVARKGGKVEEEDVRCLFITAWKADPYMRTYRELVFKPKQSVPKDQFNLFTDFPCKAVQGDCSVMDELMFMLSGENKEVQEFVEQYFAHMIQRPWEKPGISLCFYSQKQGAGKDTPLDFIGKIVGREAFFNTEDPDNQVFGTFTEHLQRTILLKMEEVSFETNKKNEQKFLSLVTAPTKTYEGKGLKPITLDDYKRIVMTTNKSCPLVLPDSDRRFVLINSSEKRVEDTEFWNRVHRELKKTETQEAYHHYLLHKDISNYDLREERKRIVKMSAFYQEVKTAQRPYHAVAFQKWIALHGEYQESCEMTATEWVSRINTDTKFPITTAKFGADAKAYPPEALAKKHGKFANSYTIHTQGMYDYLVSKGWWAD